MNQSNLKFHPIQCTSNQFFNEDQPLAFHNGEIYFLTDTRQLYLIKQEQAIEMCGGTNIIYGTKAIEYINDGHEQNPNVLFTFEDIENNIYPIINDLILNTDGCFYKVIDILEDGFYTKRITLSGTGGSYIPGGDSTIGGSGYSLTTDLKNYVYSSSADEMLVNFTANYLGSEENAIVYVGFSFDKDLSSEDAVVFYEIDTETYGFNITHSIDLINYRHLFTSSAKTIYLNTEDSYGRKRSSKITIKLVDLFLTQEYNDILKIENSIGQYSCNIGGATSGISDKKLNFSFYAPGDDIHPRNSYDIDLNVNTLGSYTCDIDTEELEHGFYTMKVTMTAQIVGTQRFLSSNTLTHKIIKFDTSNSSAILTFIFPNKVETYVNNELSYYLATAENKQYTLKIILNGTEYQELTIESNTLKTYPLYFELEGTYELTLLVSELGIKQASLITVVKYTGEIPYIDPYDKTLQLYLTPQGQSNDSTQNNQWNDYLNRSYATLTGVNFNQANGWLLDQDNISYLQLNSGGKLELTNYSPFKTDPTAVLENANKGRGLTIELDFEIDGISDYNANLIEWTSQSLENNIRNVGLIVKGNSVSFYSQQRNGLGTQGALTKIALAEGVRTRLSFVLDPKISQNNLEEYNKYFPMCYTYLNGILSNAVIYDKTDSFAEHSDYPTCLKIDSTNASIKIYNIRVYNKALGSRDILRNYIASLPTLENRSNTYEDNNVFDNTGENIDFNIVSSENYNLKIPYMVLTGGYATDEENNKWQLKEGKSIGSPGLPTGKKDYRLVDVKVVYPDTPYFHEYGGYKNYEFINQFSDGGWMTDNFGKEPINGGCIMYAQGTSSMEYPVKNLRLRFNKVKKEINGEIVKSKENYFTVRPDITPVEIICMKADYMESSGSHNTGAANLIDDLYEKANLKTPGQAHFGINGPGNKNNKEIVTCIKGYPCLIFYSPTGETNSYQYIGKYNLNLDKATPEPFGFSHDDNFGWLDVGDTYYQVQYGDKKQDYKDPFIGQLEPDEDADYVTTQTETAAKVQEGDKVNSIHCFEFLDNAVSVCNFLRKPKKYIDDGNGNLVPDPTGGYYSYEETWYEKFDNSKLEKVPGWTLGFESRYPKDRIGEHDADMLYELASWLNELYYLKTEGSEGTGSPSQKDIDEANARFKNEYELYFNKDFLLFYYIVTEALLMADNRVKNMMIATWGRSSKSYTPLTYSANNEWVIDEAAEPIETNFFEWYPIFYDMDTMLGLDNTGVDKFKYYDEDTNPDIYNGDEVLWNFVRDNLDYDLNLMYRDLETLLNTNKDQNGDWSPESVIPYFNKNQAKMANEAFYNGDAVYKYLNPARLGYKDLLNEKDILPGDAPYLYAAQGTRELARENFLINRLKFLAGKRNGNSFLNGDQVEFRWNFPTLQGYYYAEVDVANFVYEANKYYYFDEKQYVLDSNSTVTEGRKYFEYKTDNKLSKSAEKVEPSIDFILTALQPCYAGVLLGKNGNIHKEKFTANQTQRIRVSEGASANNTEAYLLGLSSLKSLNLADKYVQKFVMSGSNKLEELILGHPNKYYYNPYWSSDTSATRISLANSTYLQKFNLQNCVSFRSALDFSSCPIINTILLTGSSVSAITLPRNGNLTELRLPITIKSLVIDSHKKLEANKFSIGDYDYHNNQGQEVEEIGQGKYLNNYSQLQHIEINNTPIDTYSMVKGASQLSSYCLENINWTINSIDDVTFDDNDFVNGFKVLNTLLTKQAKKGEKLLSHIADTPGANGLSGVIKIAIPNINIDEYDIQEKYGNKFPNLQFKFDEAVIGNGYKKAYKIEFFATSDATEPYYIVYVKQSDEPSQTLKDLTTNLPIPFKESTLYDEYVFAESWKIKASDDENFIVGKEIPETNFVNIIPQCNLKLVAQFGERDRYYSVIFYNHDGQIYKSVDNYVYEEIVNNNLEAPLYAYKEHVDDKDIETSRHNRYSFKGWINETSFYDWKNSGKIPTDFIDLSSTKVTYDDMKLYPYHVEENCKELIPNYDLFTFTTENFNGVNKYTVNVKPIYHSSIQGSLVIPATDKLGNPVEAIGYTCPNSSLIYKIYFQPNNQLTNIGGESGGWGGEPGVSSGFYGLSQLKYVYFPKDQFNSLTVIGKNAFYYDSALEIIENLPNTITIIESQAFEGNGKLNLTTLPSSLKEIGARSFTWCKNISINKLPLGITEIPTEAFAYCDNLQLTTFGRNGDSPVGFENNITSIGPKAFLGSSDAYVKIVSKIILGTSLTTIDSTAFQDFGFVPSVGTEGNYTEKDLLIELYLYTSVVTDTNYKNYFNNKYITTSDIIKS